MPQASMASKGDLLIALDRERRIVHSTDAGCGYGGGSIATLLSRMQCQAM
jgi:hypothetical protein